MVENRPGAGGNLAAEFVVRSAPDGLTLLVALDSTITMNPQLYRNLPFDPQRDFRSISIIATTSNMLVVHPSMPVTSVAELIAYAKKNPITYPTAGNGTPGHLSMEYFRLQAGFESNPVPYRGNPQLVTDLVAGQIKFGFVATTGVLELSAPADCGASRSRRARARCSRRTYRRSRRPVIPNWNPRATT